MINFPPIAPSARRITQGQYAVKRFVSIAGTGTSRVYGSQPFNSQMELDFNNVSDSIALLISNAYENARGSYEGLTLPDEIWDGMNVDLRSKLQRDYTWRFAEQPSITSVVPGFSSISIVLEGQRDN